MRRVRATGAASTCFTSGCDRPRQTFRFPREAAALPVGRARSRQEESIMNALVKALSRSRLLKGDLALHLVRGSMVLIFLLFGYQKWWEYEAQTLIPFISNGPLTFWLYPVCGLRGASYFPGIPGQASSGASSPPRRS